MSDRVMYYEEIVSSLRNIAKETNIVTYDDFLKDMKTFIIDKYYIRNLNDFRGYWKSKFKKVTNDLKYTIRESNSSNNTWGGIIAEIKENRTREQHRQRTESTTSFSLSSSSSNQMLTQAEKRRFLNCAAIFKKKINEPYQQVSGDFHSA